MPLVTGVDTRRADPWRIPRWVVWVAAVLLVAPPLLLVGFLTWLHAQPNGVVIGEGKLVGRYQENLHPSRVGYSRNQIVIGGGIYMHVFQVGDRGYAIQWWDGKPLLIDGGG